MISVHHGREPCRGALGVDDGASPGNAVKKSRVVREDKKRESASSFSCNRIPQKNSLSLLISKSNMATHQVTRD